MMADKQRKIIATSSLPYANGDLHLGHMIETSQTDIWVRFQKMHGHQCFYICGSDCHGTPIMLQAEKKQLAPTQMVEEIRQQQMQDFADFFIDFDNFYTTHSTENQQLSAMIYQRLKQQGDISRRTVEQAYDQEKQMFLPDRFVKGSCPRCGSDDQYGDNCEQCGATYSPAELKNPRSVLSSTTPIMKKSEHLFFELPKHQKALQQWTNDGHLQAQVANKMQEWFKQGLQSWDISRDKPYFGFEIPGEKDKYFYVWLDAPIGYIASFKNLCDYYSSQGRDRDFSQYPDISVDEYWQADSDTELYHFIGKDVMYFHTLFWPAMLMAAKLRTPTAIYVHGFLTVNGEKMSKSRGTFIRARTYLNHFKADYLRYYFAAKLSSHIEDIDLNLENFKQRVNADLIGKLVNIASRCAGFITNKFDSCLSGRCAKPQLWQQLVDDQEIIAQAYEQREYSKAIREIMALADKANQYIAEQAPWQLIKEPQQQQNVHDICSLGINAFRLLVLYLKPVAPELAQATESFLNIEPMQWQDHSHFLGNHRIKKFKPLLQRIQTEDINAMIEAEKTPQTKQTVNDTPSNQAVDNNGKEQTTAANPFKDEITIDDFAKLDLRVAKVITADTVEGADKLLCIKLDVGGVEKQVFAGIKASYQPADLVGRQVIFLANLKPRKMRFGLSEGMILASGDNKQSFLLSADDGAAAGMIVR